MDRNKSAVAFQGKTYRPGQGNNAYVFPGIGLGAIACNARIISDVMFLAAARTLARMVSESDLAEGAIYPPLIDIRKVSLAIAVAVAEKAYEQNLASDPKSADLQQSIAESMYDPTY